MIKLIDTHAHLDSTQFDDDRDNLIQSCKDYGIEYIINPAVNFESCKKVLDLSKKYDFIYVGVGIHPHDAKEFSEEKFSEIESMIRQNKVVAIGEIGLDYHYNFSPKEQQRAVFINFLRLAKKYSKPVIIHNREADNDMMNILESEIADNLSGQLHCFSGTMDMAKKILEYRFYISFTGSITFGNKYNEIIELVPIDRILLETDSPYMSPVPHRGKRNDPRRLIYILKKIAEIKKIDEEEAAYILFQNSMKFFNLHSK